MPRWSRRTFLAALPSASAVWGDVRTAPVDHPLTRLRAWRTRLQPLMTPLPEASGSDWRVAHPERPQTFEDYMQSRPNRPGPLRTTLHLLPLGSLTAAQQPLLEAVAWLMRAHFGLPVETLPAKPLTDLPADAQREFSGQRQVRSTWLLDTLLPPLRPAASVALLALTGDDLFPEPSWNYVFGQASLSRRVGVWSLARLGDAAADFATVQRRAVKTALHETGHMLGLRHCQAWACGMNGANSLPESDRQPIAFCCECEAKLWWACRLDPVPRLDSLVAAAEKLHLAEEAARWKAQRAVLRADR